MKTEQTANFTLLDQY